MIKKLLFAITTTLFLFAGSADRWTILTDVTGKRHAYWKLQYNRLNYCEFHGKDEFVELRKLTKKHKMHTKPRKKHKNTKLA